MQARTKFFRDEIPVHLKLAVYMTIYTVYFLYL